jgi:thioredoxin:protein disulfide reductase
MIRLLSLLLALCVTAPAFGFTDEDLLEPEKAFALEARMKDANTLVAEWRIAQGYYMYRDKFGFESETPGIRLGEPRIPPGTIKDDEFFGRVETYRDHIRIEVPVIREAGAPSGLALKALSQGCADIGVCYPPLTQTAALTLPPPAAPAATTAPRESKGPLAALRELAGSIGRGGAEDLLEPEKAFRLSVEPISQNAVVARWTIAEGYYPVPGEAALRGEGLAWQPGGAGDPAGRHGHRGRVLRDDRDLPDGVDILVPIIRDEGAGRTVILAADYQGCADLGVCYPPLVQTVTFELASALAETADMATPAPRADRAPPVTEQDRIAAQLAGGQIWLVALAFFGFGLLLTFTPCVFPMIPILSNIIVGQKNLTTRKAFFISLVFVLAMALTYTVAGVFAGLAGANLQAAFQNPWIIGGFVAVFIALAMSMFGFYELQMPSSIQTRLSSISNKQEGGTLIGAAIMGFLSALIVGPCVTAPLVGALLYISQTGDALLGGVALFALSMGMGAPLLAIGTSAGKILPRAGAWMDTVKAVFGVLLLGMGIWAAGACGARRGGHAALGRAAHGVGRLHGGPAVPAGRRERLARPVERARAGDPRLRCAAHDRRGHRRQGRLQTARRAERASGRGRLRGRGPRTGVPQGRQPAGTGAADRRGAIPEPTGDARFLRGLVRRLCADGTYDVSGSQRAPVTIGRPPAEGGCHRQPSPAPRSDARVQPVRAPRAHLLRRTGSGAHKLSGRWPRGGAAVRRARNPCVRGLSRAT